MTHVSSSLAVSLPPFEGFVRRVFRASPLSVIGQAREPRELHFRALGRSVEAVVVPRKLRYQRKISGRNISGRNLLLKHLLLKHPKTSNSASNIRLEYFRMACSQAKSLAIIGNFCELTGIWGGNCEI